MIPIEQSIVGSVLNQVAEKYGLDPNLVLAIISHETNGKTFKTRYEPKWTYLYQPEVFAHGLFITAATEIIHQSMSWGLMQIMGSVARCYGFEDDLPRLTDPNLGIEYGCQHLKKKLDIHNGNEMDAIASYNAGTAVKLPSGQYSNQDYVDSVVKILTELRQLKP